MNHTTSIINLAKALLKFQCSVNKIKKDSNNPFFKSKYASLSHILDEIDDCLIDAGLVVIQPPCSALDENVVTLKTIIIHAESGEFIESEFTIPPAKKDPQGYGSCITYMRRYALTSILKLNVDDDDGNYASNTKPKGNSPIAPIKLSPQAQDLKNRMELAESVDELKSLGAQVKEEIASSEEREVLLTCYKNASTRIRLTVQDA